MTGRPNTQDGGGGGGKGPATDGGREALVLALAVAMSVKVLAVVWLLWSAGPNLLWATAS